MEVTTGNRSGAEGSLKLLRKKKRVVSKFVEISTAAGLDTLPLADRATIANMAPE